jgi:hypothetical protein
MTISVGDEKTFILSGEITALIYSFFPPSNDHNEKAVQTCMALQALINGVVLCETDCSNCRELTLKAVENAFFRALEEAPALRAEIEAEQGAQSIH